MALITRLSRLFRADIHAVLDHMEEPEVLLRQAVREMEEAMESNQREIQQLERDLTALEKHKAALAGQLEKFEAEIAACFDSDNERLAKSFIRRRLETAALHQTLSTNIEAIQERLAAQKKRYTEQQLSYESIRQKADLAWREQQLRDKPTYQYGTDTNAHAPVIEDDVELEFIRLKERFGKARAGSLKE